MAHTSTPRPTVSKPVASVTFDDANTPNGIAVCALSLSIPRQHTAVTRCLQPAIVHSIAGTRHLQREGGQPTSPTVPSSMVHTAAFASSAQPPSTKTATRTSVLLVDNDHKLTDAQKSANQRLAAVSEGVSCTPPRQAGQSGEYMRSFYCMPVGNRPSSVTGLSRRTGSLGVSHAILQEAPPRVTRYTQINSSFCTRCY